MRVFSLSPLARDSSLPVAGPLLLTVFLALGLAGCGRSGGTAAPPPPPALVFVTANLPDGLAGVAYSFTLQAFSGVPPYSWALSAGALPAGLSLDASTGVIAGTPTTVETRTFTIRLSDTADQSVSREFTVAIGSLTAFVQRVSLAADGGQANGDSGTPSLSDDARFMAFTSFATNLVASDTNNFPDVFLRDFDCQQNVLVSVSSSGVQANNLSFSPAVSGLRSDGHVMVAYVSSAPNLVPDDTNGGNDVFLTAVDATSCPPVVVDTVRVSVASDGAQAQLSDTQPPASLLPTISANGLVVGYHSNAVNLDCADSNQQTDVFVTELDFAGASLGVLRTRRASLFPARLSIGVGRTTADIFTADSIGSSALTMTDDAHIGREVHIVAGTGAGQIRSIMDNDDTILFVTPDWNPLPAASSVFRILSRELVTADIFSATTLGSSALTLENDEHIEKIIQIVDGTGEGQRRRVTDNDATTFTVDPAWSPEPDATSRFRLFIQGSSPSLRGRVSPDGSSVMFDTLSVFEEEDDNDAADVFLYDLATDDTVRLSTTFLNRPGNSSSPGAALTGDAGMALFLSGANNFSPFVVGPVRANISSSTTIGRSDLALTAGAHVDQVVLILDGVGIGQARAISGNTSTTLTVASEFNPVPDDSSVFAVTDDTNGQADLYLLDRSNDNIVRVSLANNGSQGNGAEDVNAVISVNGSAIGFSSLASNLVSGDTNNVRDIYLRSRSNETTTRISRALGDTNPNAECIDPALSLDGSTIAFSSTATNLVANDTNNARDIFLFGPTGITETIAFPFSRIADARVGQPYRTVLPALGGSRPSFWAIDAGSLPPGLFLDSTTGTVTGIPQNSGRYELTLVVTDSGRPPQRTRKTFTLQVRP